ncbi:MAG: short-chain dehydrogenase [Candidatus Rokuibacteriota bacterium]|nr:MAG: short-chain dehydrogenase [Candidatus Rokubacteria bacterium]
MSEQGTSSAREPGAAAGAEGQRRRMALITGGSGGIGLELARLFAADGLSLILVGRDRRRLEAAGAQLRAQYQVPVRCMSRDLSESRAAFELWADLTASGADVDVLVNNAGVGLYGPVDTQDPDALERMVQLNVAALTTLTRLALPAMRRRGWGRILNVASVVAFQPAAPRMAAYYASKAYVLSFSRGLSAELKGSGVSITVLAPGPTETQFDDTSDAAADVLYKRLPKMSPAAVARAGYRGLIRGAKVVVPGFLAKVMAFAGELPPRSIALEVNRLLWKPPASRRGSGS